MRGPRSRPRRSSVDLPNDGLRSHAGVAARALAGYQRVIRIGTTKPATCAPINTPTSRGANVSVIAMIAAMTAKLVAQTAVRTTLMWTNSGVSQNSRSDPLRERDGERPVNSDRDGRRDRERCRDERGDVTLHGAGRVGERDHGQSCEEHQRGDAEGIGVAATAVPATPTREPEREGGGLPAEQRRATG